MEQNGDTKRAGEPIGTDPYFKREPRKLVLCFDGTGNKFHGDESDSNILKIFRMLDRTAADQYHYYQPGIGTYVTTNSLSHSSTRSRLLSWYNKAKDSAIGCSFDQHVVGGYRFLMRFYNPGDEIYMFGFSRGAYIARFLAEMLDQVGLLSHGNEEMVRFAWKAFSQWQCRRGSDKREMEEEREGIQTKKKSDPKIDEKTEKMYQFMKAFRETFSRPVGRIRFIGLFDTVNSVPQFENAWMQRSKFPYTARSSAKFIRHAVSIDERRAKFRQDLLYQLPPGFDEDHHHHHHHHHSHMEHILAPLRQSMDYVYRPSMKQPTPSDAEKDLEVDQPDSEGRKKTGYLSPDDGIKPQEVHESRKIRGRRASLAPGQCAPYRPRSRSRASSNCRNGSTRFDAVGDAGYCSDDESEQDIDEVWFAGGHGDIGGGWEALDDRKSASHVPLSWIVRAAMEAGLDFDMEKVVEMGCADAISRPRQGEQRKGAPMEIHNPDIRVSEASNGSPRGMSNGASYHAEKDEDDEVEGKSHFHRLMHRAHTSQLHDSLQFGQGLGAIAVAAWQFMEWLPFRRMDLQTDGSWKPIRWPLPRGEVRDIPSSVRVHGSVIRRLRADPNYRPGNLIIGGGGRGVRKAEKEHGIGEWECIAEKGDPVGEVWVKTRKQRGNKP